MAIVHIAISRCGERDRRRLSELHRFRLWRAMVRPSGPPSPRPRTIRWSSSFLAAREPGRAARRGPQPNPRAQRPGQGDRPRAAGGRGHSGSARRRWLAACGAPHRCDFVHGQSAGAVASGSDQPDPTRTRRALGRRSDRSCWHQPISSGSRTSRVGNRGIRGRVRRSRKRLGGDGIATPTERTPEQTETGIYWAYDGTPSLCAPPRLYNQITVHIADQMRSGSRRAGAAAGAGERGDGRRRHRDLGVEIPLRILAAHHRHPRVRPRQWPHRSGRRQCGDPGRSDVHAARRAGQQSRRAELHAAVPGLSVRPRRIRRRPFPDVAPVLPDRSTSRSPSCRTSSTV